MGRLPPAPTARKTTGYFDREDYSLFFQGEDTPIGKYSRLAVSLDGEWAAFVSPEDKNVYLIVGKNKQKSMLLFGWCDDLQWLGSIK